MYHDLFTEKSWQVLKELKGKYHFVLIGGWAVYLYTHLLKSKDIDIIVPYEMLHQLRAHYDLYKNGRLKKYEIHIDEIDVDIYVPFFSNLGIPAEEVTLHSTVIEGFTLPQKEMLLILKQKAWGERKGSLKGEKDELDIIGLASGELEWKKYLKLLSHYYLSSYAKDLSELLSSRTETKELNINAHQYAKLKKRIKSFL